MADKEIQKLFHLPTSVL